MRGLSHTAVSSELASGNARGTSTRSRLPMRMLKRQKDPMAQDNMDALPRRIARVPDDLRVIQRELNCAAMQAPSDPELMEALTQLPEIESLELLRSALGRWVPALDRKSTRLNSSHGSISYAVFCLKKKIILYVDIYQ